MHLNKYFEITEDNEAGIPLIKSFALDRSGAISHGFTTRIGGVSPGPFGSLNVGIAVGDEEENVRQNRETISRAFSNGASVYLSQVHGSDVAVIESLDELPCHDSIKADALVTGLRGVQLVIQTADCQAVLLHDPVKNVVAAVHSGWRGNVCNILSVTVGKMKAVYGSDPADILASIGPSLGPCCAEFVNYRMELPESFWRFGDERNLFDFWAISRWQLEEEGLMPENISISGYCTKCDQKNFFSYRRSGKTGRMAGFIGLI